MPATEKPRTVPLPAVQFTEVSKGYGQFQALDGVTFDVLQGEVTALLGPNGAGKSTLIDILGGVSQASGGVVTVLGRHVTGPGSIPPGVLGIMLQDAGFIPELTVGETVRSWSRFQGGDPDLALKRVDLGDKVTTRVSGLSGGERRRLDLALALLNEPDIVVLDEPTTGMDPDSREHAIQLIADLSKNLGMTVILTTHLLDEAQRLADSVIILRAGHVVAQRRATDASSNDSRIEFAARKPIPEAFLEQLQHQGFTAEGDTDTYSATTSRPQKDLLVLLEAAERTGATVDELRVRPHTIEDLYFQATLHQPEPLS